MAVLVGVAGNRAARNACLDVAAIRAQVDARIAVRRFVAANGAARHGKRSVLPGGVAGPHIYAAAISSSGIVADFRTGNGQLRAAISQHAGPAAAPVLLVDNCLVAFDDAAGKHCRAVEQIHAAAIAFNLVVADGTIRHVDRSAVCIHCRALVVFQHSVCADVQRRAPAGLYQIAAFCHVRAIQRNILQRQLGIARYQKHGGGKALRPAERCVFQRLIRIDGLLAAHDDGAAIRQSQGPVQRFYRQRLGGAVVGVVAAVGKVNHRIRCGIADRRQRRQHQSHQQSTQQRRE